MVLGAAIFYLLLAVAGGVTYFLLLKSDKLPIKDAAVSSEELSPKQTENTLPDTTAAKPEAEPANEDEKKPPISAADARIAELTADMSVVYRGSLVFYHYQQDSHPAPGVYLRPFIIETTGGPIMKNDIYFFAQLEGGGYFDWIRGDALLVQTGNFTDTFYLDASERRDRLGQGAETLFENYVFDADEKTLAMFRAIRAANWGRVTYYAQESGKSYTDDLSPETVRRISHMIELYDLLEESYR